MATLDLVIVALWLLAAVVFALYAWDLLVSLAGFLPFAPPPETGEHKRFAVLVCAHNEEGVVAGVIRSLVQAAYPRDRLDIFVVADNCSDNTATVAAHEGAEVLVRQDPARRTKGFALQYGIKQIRDHNDARAPSERYDAVCVFDADNHVAPDFFVTMGAYLAAGHVAIQAYLDTRNPTTSWVTRCIALAYFVTNRFWLRARARLGLPATLGGTGFCLAWETMVNFAWDPGSLADDLDLTMRLIDHDVPVTFCPHTRTFDEKPTTLRASLRQRSRWMQGHNDVAWRWAWPMCKRIWCQPLFGPALRGFDALLHLLQPVRILLAFFLLATLFGLWLVQPQHPYLVSALWFTTPGWGLALFIFVLYPLVVAAMERAPWGHFLYAVPFFFFGLTWIPAILVGLWRVRRRVWVHTPHGSPQ